MRQPLTWNYYAMYLRAFFLLPFSSSSIANITPIVTLYRSHSIIPMSLFPSSRYVLRQREANSGMRCSTSLRHSMNHQTMWHLRQPAREPGGALSSGVNETRPGVAIVRCEADYSRRCIQDVLLQHLYEIKKSLNV